MRWGFVLDRQRTLIGRGAKAFGLAIREFKQWTQFDLGWARVANPQTSIEPGRLVVVEVHSLGLWSLNLSQIVAIDHSETRFGFIYKTTAHHLEQGEERFLLQFDRGADEVWYETEAVSRPRSLFAWMGYPVTRHLQQQFAQDSHLRMRKAVTPQEAESRRL